jgi:homoserine O-acetyltransferase/O-succinyltransferase
MIRHIVIVLAALPLGWSAVAAHAQSGNMIVEKKTFELPSYITVAGETIKSVKIGWEAAGTLNADKSNAILVTHYFSGTTHATLAWLEWRQLAAPATVNRLNFFHLFYFLYF